MVAFFTDGVVEAESHGRVRFGVHRALQLIQSEREKPAPQIVAAVYEESSASAAIARSRTTSPRWSSRHWGKERRHDKDDGRAGLPGDGTGLACRVRGGNVPEAPAT